MKKKYAVIISLVLILVLYILYAAIFIKEKVEVEKIHKGDLTTVIYATGVVSADSIAVLRSESGGIVKFIKPFEGSRVKKGELLLKVDQADQLLQLQQAQNNLNTSKVDLNNEKINFERVKNLIKSNTITQKEYDDASNRYELAKLKVDHQKILVEIAKENLSKTEIYAPFSGVITSVKCNLGDNLPGNSECFELVVPSSIMVIGNVDEQDISKISLGQKAKLAFDAYPSKEFDGYVYRIAPKTNEDTKTSHVYLKIQDGPKKLNVGMTATINIKAGEFKNVLLIPRISIIHQGNEDYVYLVKNNCLEKTKIKVGANNSGKYTNLIEGRINEGDLIAANPKDSWTNGKAIEVVKK